MSSLHHVSAYRVTAFTEELLGELLFQLQTAVIYAQFLIANRGRPN